MCALLLFLCNGARSYSFGNCDALYIYILKLKLRRVSYMHFNGENKHPYRCIAHWAHRIISSYHHRYVNSQSHSLTHTHWAIIHWRQILQSNIFLLCSVLVSDFLASCFAKTHIRWPNWQCFPIYLFIYLCRVLYPQIVDIFAIFHYHKNRWKFNWP